MDLIPILVNPISIKHPHLPSNPNAVTLDETIQKSKPIPWTV